MPSGPYGQDLYGVGAEAFPASPLAFAARPGIQGPQVILTWEPPVQQAITALMIRRKLREHPRHPEDGTLLLLDSDDPMALTSHVDAGDDLLAADALPGEGRWWYYRAFVQAAPPPLADQLGQHATGQLIPFILPTSKALPLHDRRTVRVYLEHLSGAGATVIVSTGPTLNGPWLTLASIDVAIGAAVTWQAAQPLAYLRLSTSAGGQIRFSVCGEVEPQWLTAANLTASVLTFKSGRHMEFAQRTGLPQTWWARDEVENVVPVSEAEGPDGERFNYGETGRGRGHLWKLLSIVLAEFDRVDAYLRAVKAFAPDYDQMPPQMFAHVAHVLGYPLETDGRNLEDVRAEILRIAGVWKSKGTTRLAAATCRQILGVTPRLQEGAGRVFRVANPDLYRRPPPPPEPGAYLQGG